jgi:uncharacterized protein
MMSTKTSLGLSPIDAERAESDCPLPGHSGHRPAARLVSGAIRTYQLARSGHVSPCRFTPTCSQYALEAVQTHGAWRGLGLAVRRLGRCRPGGPSGYDPVPE